MQKTLVAVLGILLVAACNGGGENNTGPLPPACSDGDDNDADGMVDFPDDLGCTNENDESEDSSPSAKCQDGRDNDGDGFIDYPYDPGCFAPQADDEVDDCPSGPQCPECSDGEDNDGNGSMDYPGDPGCVAAADDSEFLSNPVACGANLSVQQIPPTGLVMGELGTSSTSMVTSPCGGGGGTPAFAFELHLNTNRVVEISTDDALTTVDTVIDVRAQDCMSPDASLACNDDLSSTNEKSKLTVPLLAGTYYVIVSGQNTASQGTFAMQVKTFAGQGSACADASECGPGLVCRVALGASSMTCEKPECDDGLDTDQDGDGADYPDDPGCTSRTDNDESDDCPNGPNCPECSDDEDNDSDGQTDYGMDTTCAAAGDSSESCITTDGVTLITTAMTMGDTTGANNDVTPTSGSPGFCGPSSGHMSPDRTYRLDLPAMSSLLITNTNTFDASVSLLGSSCTGAPLACDNFPDTISLGSLSAGAYFYVVDGYDSATDVGMYTINVSGKIANGGSCEGALAQAGALTCNMGFTCKGPAGSRTCQPGLCGDGMDNDSDGKTDYPFDPGCTDLGDDTEQNPAQLPVCSNGTNDDGDAFTDFPADFGCTSAAGGNEQFCVGEMDAAVPITAKTTTGTTVGLMNNWTSASNCAASGTSPPSNGPDVAYGIQVPVFLNSLTMDLSNSSISDTVLQFRDANCAAQIACDDDSGDPGLQSKLTVSNVAPGNYAVIVDGYGSSGGNAGMYNLVVTGVAAAGQACTSPMFSGGANAILTCPTACVSGVCQ